MGVFIHLLENAPLNAERIACVIVVFSYKVFRVIQKLPLLCTFV